MAGMTKHAHLIANKKSGKGGGATLADRARTLAKEHGFEVTDHEIRDASEFATQAKRAVDAAEKDGGLVIAAGGDGTIRGVAQEAHERAVDAHAELRAAPERVRELLRVEFGRMRFGRAFDGGDERVGGFEFPDAEFPARVQQAGELPALDVPGVVPHEAGRGGEERC